MINMKKILSIVIVGLILWASPVEANDGYISWKTQALSEFSTEPIDDEGTTTYAYGKASPETQALVRKRTEEAKTFTLHFGNDPILWWLLGELGLIEQRLYLVELKRTGKAYFVDAPENQALVKEYQSYYLKALDLDDLPDAPDHLAGLMLARIGDDVLGTTDIKARAMKKAGDLARASKDGTEWNTYEARLGIYARAKDYDNYLKTVNEMIERIPNNPRMDELEGYKRQAEELIAKRDGKAVPEAP